MTYAPEVYTGDGVTTDFAIPFSYLDAGDIDVFVAGVVTAFTFPSASLIQITPAPAADATVKIVRSTGSTARNVIFPSASSLTALQLNKSADQLFYLAEEAVAIADEALHLNSADVFDALSKRLVNIADPVSANDAATKGYIDATFAGQIATVNTQVTAASASATAAALSATNSNTYKLAADADRVQTGLDRIAVAADKVTVAADKALVATDKATVIAQKALVDTAKTAVDTQKALVDTAKTAVDSQKALVDTAKTAVDTAKGLVDTAKAAADADVVLTHADVVLTHADVVLTEAAKVAAQAAAGAMTTVPVQIEAATVTVFADADKLAARKAADGSLISWSWAAVKSALASIFVSITGTTMTGNLAINKITPSIILDKTLVAQRNNIFGRLTGLGRWNMILGDESPESGGNIGSNFALSRWDDAGAYIDNVLYIYRGSCTVAGTLIASAAEILSNVGAKLLTVNGVWAAANPVNLGATLTGNITLNFATFIKGYGTATGNITFNAISNAKNQDGTIRITASGADRTAGFNTAAFATPNNKALAAITSGTTRLYSYSYDGNLGKCILIDLGTVS